TALAEIGKRLGRKLLRQVASIEIHARVPARKISYGSSLAIAKGPMLLTANAARSFLLSLQDHDPNLGISKHTPHPSARPESRKAIASSSLFFFPGIQASCHSRRGLSCGQSPQAIEGDHVRRGRPSPGNRSSFPDGLDDYR